MYDATNPHLGPGLSAWAVGSGALSEPQEGTPRLMVRFLDPDGIPRAWAIGPLDQAGEVKVLAEQNLAAYRKAKLETGDPLAHAHFTMRAELVSEE